VSPLALTRQLWGSGHGLVQLTVGAWDAEGYLRAVVRLVRHLRDHVHLILAVFRGFA